MMKRMLALTMLGAVWLVLAGCEPQDTGAPFEPRVGEAERDDAARPDESPQAVPGEPARPGEPAQPAPGEPAPGQQRPMPGQAEPSDQTRDPAREDWPEDPERQTEPERLD